MKTLKFTSLFVLALAISTRLLAQDSQQLTVPLSDPGKPFKLEVSLTTGSIKVSLYEGKDIVIDAEPKGRNDDRDDRRANNNGMRRISGGANLDLTAREKNNTVTVGTGSPNKNVTISIKIPQGASSIKLSTVNGGNINVNDVNTDMELNNTNGGIYLHNVSGSAVATTTNGPVVAVFKSIDPKAAMAFTTLNGNVDVTFPAGLKANIKARSDQGNVFSDFDVATDKTAPKTTKTAKDGMYRITIEDWINGKINGGGPEMLFKNMNGSIYIKKAK